MLRISAAKIAAFPPESIPRVATGTPGGMFTMDRRASNPPIFIEHGTPITGFSVKATTAPVTWAESPDMAINSKAFLFLLGNSQIYQEI